MSTKFIKIAVFFLTLVLGVQTAAFVSSLIADFSMPVEIPTDPDEKRPELAVLPSDIQVMYVGSSASGEGLRFIIFNGSTENVSCIGYNGHCASPEIRVSGRDVAAWVCMNGSSTYTIEPGRSAELMVGAHNFARLPSEAEKITIGYAFADATVERPSILPSRLSFHANSVKRFEAIWRIAAAFNLLTHCSGSPGLFSLVANGDEQ